MLINSLTNHAAHVKRSLGGTLLILIWVGFSTLAWGGWKDDIGYTQLKTLLGSSIPNGGGVPISQVEAGDSNGFYFPNVNDSNFTAVGDPAGVAVVFTDGSGGQSNGVSTHATGQAQIFYGNTVGIAPAANAVTIYSANGFISNVLKAPNGGDPIAQDFRVQNHSWVGSFAVDPNNPTTSELDADRSTLQRFDYVIDNNEITAVVGLNNGTAPLPSLLSQSYNAIAVGRSDGLHSSGLTNLVNYGVDRSKPDLVVPRTSTSTATSSTSSAATLLHSAVTGSDAAKSETMKAILLAGATKAEFPTWSRTSTQPLDDTYGAGELNVYNSYLMTVGGQTLGSSDSTGALVKTASSYGWDYQTINPGSDLFYNFEVPVGSTAGELSIILDWNVEVTDTNPGVTFSGSESLANLDLELYDSSAGFLSTRIDKSISSVDNVEHIYQTGLGPGTYTLKVSGASSRDFGLAWRMNTLFDVASADFDGDGGVDGSDFLAWQSGFGTPIGASHAMGDADGDGDVDSVDGAFLDLGLGSLLLPPVLVASVPEPTTLSLFLTGILLLRKNRRSITRE